MEAASWIATETDARDAKFMRAGLLRVDGRPAAFSFDLEADGVAYAVADSHVPDQARHSPGKLLYTRNLLDKLGRGIARVDRDPGDSGYKQVIGAEQGPTLRDWLFVRPGAGAAGAGRGVARGPALMSRPARRGGGPRA